MAVPKPLSRNGNHKQGAIRPRPALIFVDIWRKKYWTYHAEEKFEFAKLDDAREWAKKRHFDGIKLRCADFNDPACSLVEC